MDNNVIRSFAIESRRSMIDSVKYQANLIGISCEGINNPISRAEGMETYDYGAGTHSIYDEDIKKRNNLVKEIENRGYDAVIEEVAYTWFNRIIAIRFLEVNDYLPTRTRVLSSETGGKTEPDIVTDALELDLDYINEDKQVILRLKDENELDELFRFLFIKQCNKLNDILPGLFKKTDDWMELLLNINFTSDDGIIANLINQIPEEDFREQVEIIGWLYQYYNTELKEDTFKHIKKNKVPKDRIPSATQIFTPDWIVKYMVENSLGKLWLEEHFDLELKNKWRYYVDSVQDDKINQVDSLQIPRNIKLEEIKIIDPCMGSGHILVYVFDVLMQIYLSLGYSKYDASVLILNNNIYGLDIDDRAYQLAYFAIMMKARQYNRNILKTNITPNIFSFTESNYLNEEFIFSLVNKNPKLKEELFYVKELFIDSKIYGSFIKPKKLDLNQIFSLINEIKFNKTNFDNVAFKKDIDILEDILNQINILNKTYDVVITNPPYMGSKNMDKKLNVFLKKNYPNSDRDLYSSFIERGFELTKNNGFNCMVTMQSWMFTAIYENLRRKILENYTIANLLHLDNNVMISFSTAATIFKNQYLKNYEGIYNFITVNDLDENNVLKDDYNLNKKCFKVKKNRFFNIPRSPIAYWVDDNLVNSFELGEPLSNYGELKIGLSTSDNTRFLRHWYEVSNVKCDFSTNKNKTDSPNKWFPLNKGGSFRKWYGNHDYVINYENNGFELKNFEKSVMRNQKFYFKSSISWSKISKKVAFRYYPEGFLFDTVGSSFFVDNDLKDYIIGFLNSNMSQTLLDLLAPTLSFTISDIASLPLKIDYSHMGEIKKLTKINKEICKHDWDDYELSWNFLKHPLLKFDGSLKNRFICWEEFKETKFINLKNNEIRLNEIFSEIYNVKIDVNVKTEDISISLANYEKDIKSFISYAVGCMFGRYSLDNEGLQFAGGNFDLTKYSKFEPDNDNIIPVLDTEYFEDDIVGRFVEFVKICFGEETLEENLDFIAGALNKKGKTSREIIRNYFLTDFFKNHVQIYQKCPIYWMFNSGKQNAFNCLIYMHRYQPDLIARVRTDYLHKTQKAIEQNVSHCDNIITNSTNKSEVSKATKDKNKYIKQLDEIKVYDEALRHMATQNIEIDLDDGVKVNYAKFQKIEISIEGEKPKKINLLKNI